MNKPAMKPVPLIARSTMLSTSETDVLREIVPQKAEHFDQSDDDYRFIERNLRRWGDRYATYDKS